MNSIKLNKIVNKYYSKELDFESKEIISFIMDRDYFIDVFETRYVISKEINNPIIGLKETLYSFKKVMLKKSALHQ